MGRKTTTEKITTEEWIELMREYPHHGDPCIHCNTPHDDVASGPCAGRLIRRVRELEEFEHSSRILQSELAGMLQQLEQSKKENEELRSQLKGEAIVRDDLMLSNQELREQNEELRSQLRNQKSELDDQRKLHRMEHAELSKCLPVDRSQGKVNLAVQVAAYVEELRSRLADYRKALEEIRDLNPYTEEECLETMLIVRKALTGGE